MAAIWELRNAYLGRYLVRAERRYPKRASKPIVVRNYPGTAGLGNDDACERMS